MLAADSTLARTTTTAGITALWWLPNDETAAYEAVGILLSHGADPSVRSTDGRTAADRARERGLTRAADALTAAAARASSAR